MNYRAEVNDVNNPMQNGANVIKAPATRNGSITAFDRMRLVR